jgi:hypothetical protein
VALTLPCTQCAPNAPAVVVGDEIRCLNCETVRPLVRAPLYLVTGAPGTGKSTIVPLIAGRIPETGVFDTDLFGPMSHPDWEAWATSWLLLVHALAQSGLQTVLVGYGLSRSKAMSLAAKDLLGPVRVLNLDLRPDALRERLSQRGTYDPARIERKIAAAAVLRREADENVDVTNAVPQAIADRVLKWLASVT